MNTKNYKTLYLPFLLAFVALFSSCSDDDNTRMGEVNISNPSITVSGAENIQPFVEQDSTITLTLSIPEPQSVAIRVHLSQIGGEMTGGADYTMDSEVTIPAGETSVETDIEFLEDESAEETETLQIQIGDDRTANATLTPVTYSFTLTNTTSEELDVTLSWTTSIFDLDGVEVDPTDAADLIFIISDLSGVGEDIVVDGAGFEDATLGADLPDGQYSLIAAVYSVADVGDLGSDFDIGLVLDLHQIGKIDESVTFPAAMNSGDVECAGYSYRMGIITKVGDDFSFEETGELYLGPCGLEGTHTVEEAGRDAYEASFSIDAYDPFTLANDNFWNAGIEVLYVLDTESDAVTIEAQEFDFDLDGEEGPGEEEPLTVEGTGTYNLETGTMVVDYMISKANGDVVESNTQTLTMVE